MRIKMNRLWASLLALIMAVSLAGCDDTSSVSATPEPTPMVTATPEPEPIEPPATATPAPEETSTPKPEVAVATEFDINSVPAYSGMQYVIVNDNVPYFTDSDMTTETFENYSPLDEYGPLWCCVRKYLHRIDADRGPRKYQRCNTEWLG